jgi:phage terminase large subunit GpA-like protein
VIRTVIDSGGLHTEQVYRYARARYSRGVFPIKGGSLSGRPLVERPSVHNRYGVPLFVLCVDTGKDIVMSRLMIPSPGPGYSHLPEWADEEYPAQLTAEKAIRKYVKGRGAVREWVKLRERNEALDLEVYALAALYIMGPTMLRALGELAACAAAPFVRDKSADLTPAARSRPLRPRGRWSGWARPRPGGWLDV